MNSFIVSVLARSDRPVGLASAWRAESTLHGDPQGVGETRWQTDTSPSDPRSEDLGSEKTAEIAHPGGTWLGKRLSSNDWPSVANRQRLLGGLSSRGTENLGKEFHQG